MSQSTPTITLHASSSAGDFAAGQSTNTPLTPNSNAVASASGDSNDDTTVAFQYNGVTTYWSPTVSSATTDVTLGANRGNGVVMFQKGLQLSYLAQAGGIYTIVVSGTITDSGSEYVLTGRSLGSFPQKNPPK
jgi:hypothetical protein